MKTQSRSRSTKSITKQTKAQPKVHIRSSRPNSSVSPTTAFRIPIMQIVGNERKLNARPDPIDFRDRMFEPTLIEVPPRIQLAEYRRYGVPILNQGNEGACTGFGLATIANYLLRRRSIDPSVDQVSPRMLYEMAKRYDEWPGEGYSGSSARGAVKGWHKHGVCLETSWPYAPDNPGSFTETVTTDAARRPLGAYYRVNHEDIVSLHSAIAEVGILYATAKVHTGWNAVTEQGDIPFNPDDPIVGGHAFAIVAYDENGFWVQNSWGLDWGVSGFARVSYDDWLANGTDTWVARLGVPTLRHARQAITPARSDTAKQAVGTALNELRPHIVNLGNDGRLRPSGAYGTTEEDVKTALTSYFVNKTSGWAKKRILLYAHGGMVAEDSAAQWIDKYLPQFLAAEIYPITFIWHSDFQSTLQNVLEDAIAKRKSGDVASETKNFMLDRVDDVLEPLARQLGAKLVWDEIKENALLATQGKLGGARYTLAVIADLIKNNPSIELHLACHSAGSIFFAPFIQYMAGKGKLQGGPMAGQTGLGLHVNTCTLWAPGCRVELFKETYLPALQTKCLDKLALFTLTDDDERDDDVAKVYNKSVLYLVSDALEQTTRVPVLREDGEPLLGMAKFVQKDPVLKQLFQSAPNAAARWVLTPTVESKARHHIDFDRDDSTIETLRKFIVS